MKLIVLLGLVLGVQNLIVVGGQEVNPAFRYPWIVSLQKYGIHLCGGTLYNARTVITAAHCMAGNLEKWTAHLHRHNLDRSVLDEAGLVFPIIQQINHPGYNDGFNKKYDVSIWKINGVAVQSISLASDMPIVKDTLITIIGWGRVNQEGQDSKILLEAKLPIYNQTRCKELYSTLHLESQFCAGYPLGKIDACQGDSGGPGFTLENGNYSLAGVISWGRGCAKKNNPGVFTRIHKVKQFILDNSE